FLLLRRIDAAAYGNDGVTSSRTSVRRKGVSFHLALNRSALSPPFPTQSTHASAIIWTTLLRLCYNRLFGSLTRLEHGNSGLEPLRRVVDACACRRMRLQRKIGRPQGGDRSRQRL